MAPHILPGSRDGQRMGDWKLLDTMLADGLNDAFEGLDCMNRHGWAGCVAQQCQCGVRLTDTDLTPEAKCDPRTPHGQSRQSP